MTTGSLYYLTTTGCNIMSAHVLCQHSPLDGHTHITVMAGGGNKSCQTKQGNRPKPSKGKEKKEKKNLLVKFTFIFKYQNFSHVQSTVRLLISNFRCVLNAVCFLPGNSPVSEFYMLTFRNTLSVPSSYLSTYEGGTDSVPKHRHIKFRSRGITQKEAYNSKTPW